MDGLIDRSRPTGSRERASYHAGVGLGSKDFSLEGYGRVGKHMKHYTVDFDSNPNNGSATEDIFCNALHGGQHKEVDETLLESHKEEKKQSLVENRRSSPSVIARLMGLDELPLPAVLSESQKDNAGSLLKNSFVDFEENYKSSGRHEYTTSRSGIQTSRAAQELVSSSNAKKHNDQVVPENLCSKPDVAFIMKQFVEANCLSTSETLQESKELNDALDVLDANKDLFSKFLREPNSVYAKHLHDLKFSKCFGQMSDTRFSKPLDGKMHENNEPFYRVVEETEQCKEKHKDAAYCCSKSTGNLAKHSANMPTDSLLQKLLISRYAGKFETSSHTTSIVLLKPSFQKVQSTIRVDSLSRPLQSRHPICRRRGEVRQDLLDGREQSESFDLKTGGYKAKGARELFGDSLHPVKLSSKSCSQGVRTLKVENCDSSSSHLGEPYLSREARKRLSERWKLTQPSNVKLLEGTSTLAEMLSLSDTEAPSTLDQFIRVSNENVANDDIHESRAYPSGISSRDGWKDDSGTSVAKSKHLPASATIYGTSKPQSGKQVDSFDDCYMLKDVLNLEQNDLLDLNIKRGHSLLRNFKNWQNKRRNITSCGEENKSPECEVELHHDDQRRKTFLNDLIEHKTVFSRLSQRNKADLGHLVYSSSTPKSLGSNIHALAKLEEFQQPVKLNCLSSDAIEEVIAEGSLFDSTEVEASLEDLKQYEPSIVPKFAEHPSPVSVLDPPSEDEKSSPECLESISAALQGKGKQLLYVFLSICRSANFKAT
ncbi:hypothetical protein AXF42_Ash017427 [Apostasia shenzhenica]|uniref:DUF3741 domain-containing protein n=1 Tax=Apostasia shenzhenica TaxID=1088818 RepID=A0A2H9ZYZ6_9ASPA|nr:hypothetical protein AXF42_Ash017427 [Apostasia shenzhenica]